MLPQWVPFLRSQARPKGVYFSGRLFQVVTIGLLLAVLLPILLIGTLNIFHSHQMLRGQLTQTLSGVTDFQTNQINAMVAQRNQAMDVLVKDENFRKSVVTLFKAPMSSKDYNLLSSSVNGQMQQGLRSPTGTLFDHLFIMRPNGVVIVATDPSWAANFLGKQQVQYDFLWNLLDQNKNEFYFSPFLRYSNRLILFTSRTIKDDEGVTVATLFGLTDADEILRVLQNGNTLLPNSTSSYFLPNGTLITLSGNDRLKSASVSKGFASRLLSVIQDQKQPADFQAAGYQKDMVLASAKWLPELGVGVVVSIPVAKVPGLANSTDPFSIVLLVIALLIAGGLVYLGTRYFVQPILQIAATVNRFAQGNRDERLRIYRTDEIGLLASSFNHIANELNEFNGALDGVVEKRSEQMRIASDIAQRATSTAKLDESLGSTVDLIAQQFGFYHVAIYLYDEHKQNLVLREASGTASAQIKQLGDQIAVDTETLISWVANHHEAKIISKVHEDALFRPNELLPDTLSEAAAPIALGDEILGVLDIQSTLENAFDSYMVSIIQALANQISSTFRTLRTLEATQVNYRETALLYKTTQQITQSRSEADIVNYLTEAFLQLPYLGAVLSVEGENFKISVLTDHKTGKADKGLQSLNIPVGQMGNLLIQNRIVLIEDISQPNDYDNMVSFLLRRECKTAALISVIENGYITKVLVLGSREANQFSTSNLQPFANLAEVIGATQEKYRVLNTLQKRLSELQLLASFSQAISAETNLDSLYRVLHEQVMQTLGPEMEFCVALYNASDAMIEFPYIYENQQMISVPPVPLGAGLTSILIESQQPLLLKNIEEIHARTRITNGKPSRSWMGVPLIFAGQVLGAVIVQDLVNEYRFTQDDLNLFMTLAPQIATSVRNTQLYTETQQALLAYDQERFLLNTLLENIPEGVSFKDAHGRFIRASQSLAKTLGIQAEEMIGKTDFDLMDRESAEKTFREEQMVMNLGQAEIGHVQKITTPAGESWIQTSRIPVRTKSGDPYGILLIWRDITDIKQAEALSQQRAEQLLTAAEIARDATGTLDVNTLLQKSVNLVRERFGFYHASIFLEDVSGEYAVLRESTGEAGAQMMKAGHRLAIGSKSIVGQVTSKGTALIVNDVTSDPNHLPNPLLPETRSELAIPLKVGERVLGALDVQSTQVNAFNTEDVNVLQILADQMAVAVVNGDLFARTQELLSKHRLLRQITIQASASTNLDDAMVNVVSALHTAKVSDRIAIMLLNQDGQLQVQASAGYEGTRHLSTNVALGQGITGKAAVEKRSIRVDDVLNDPRYFNIDTAEMRSELAIPILFSDELIGVLNLESIQVHAFDENDQEILGALGNNLGGVIANMRLVSQVRQQVQHERQLFDITSKIRRSVDLEAILETSAKEIAQALGARRASIRITSGKITPVTEIQDGAVRTNGNGYGKDGTAALDSSTGLTGSNGAGRNNGADKSNGHKNGQEG